MNKDTFRKQYKKLNQISIDLIAEAKEQAETLEQTLDKITNREMSLAKTNLEQCVMWATKAIVLHDDKLDEISDLIQNAEKS